MPRHKTLTDQAAKRLAIPDAGQVDHFDSSYPGLVLRVSCGGRKAWNYLTRTNGKLTRIKLDNYPPMTVAEAHEAWRAARDSIKSGLPVAAGGVNFRSVFEDWMKRDQANNRSASAVRGKLEKDVLPHWQHRQIGDIGRQDVQTLIDRIADRGTVITARRIHASLHRLFAWAVGRGLVESNPLANLPKPGSETRRDRVLTDAELKAVWCAADGVYGWATKLLILTGARREEISQLRWSEIDGDTITLEGSRTKTGVPQIIPLSSAARMLLASVPRIAGSDYVFTTNGANSLCAWGRAKARLDALVSMRPWTIHDLRRTVATGLQKLGIPQPVTEAVLGHSGGSRGGIVGVYQRHDYATEKAAALEAWGAYVVNLTK